jgi:hypothetical protein
LLIPFIPGINGAAAPGSNAPTINAGTVRNTGFRATAFDYKNKFFKFLFF